MAGGKAILGEVYNCPPRALDMDVIPPGTHVNTHEAYDILLEVKARADILLPLHEPRFAAVDTIP